MNKKNLKLLIEEIEKPENHFNWGQSNYCLAGYAKKISGKKGGSSSVLKEFLNLSEDEAIRLFIGKKIKSRTQIAHIFSDSGSEQKKKALRYLRELLTGKKKVV